MGAKPAKNLSENTKNVANPIRLRFLTISGRPRKIGQTLKNFAGDRKKWMDENIYVGRDRKIVARSRKTMPYFDSTRTFTATTKF